jgi:hypothetical protein
MDGVREARSAEALPSFFAGLQTGLQGTLAMLVWLGISAAWLRRSFWTSENLMATMFYGNRALHAGFGGYTLSGLAVYLLLYSLLGGLLAWVVRDRVPRLRVLMLSVLFSLVWYYLSYRMLWNTVAPLVTLLHVERATVLGHLVYGTFLARYPLYLPHPAPPPAPAEPPPVEASTSTGPPEPPSETPPPAETPTSANG